MSSYLEWKKRALLMGAGGWWVPNEYDPSNCAFAYRFRGASDVAESYQDLTGNGKTLTNSTGNWNAIGSSFNSATGWTLANNGLNAYDFLNNEDTETWRQGEILPKTIKTAILRVGTIDDAAVQGYTVNVLTAPDIYMMLLYDENSGFHVQSGNNSYYAASKLAGEIIGVDAPENDNSASVYINGTAHTLQGTPVITVGSYVLFGGGFTYAAGAFYYEKLTAKQHKEIYERMALL